VNGLGGEPLGVELPGVADDLGVPEAVVGEPGLVALRVVPAGDVRVRRRGAPEVDPVEAPVLEQVLGVA